MTDEEIRALWDFDRPEESERRFREALAADSGDLSSSAEILTQIARAQGLQKQFESAHAILDEIEALEEFEHPRIRIRTDLERGRLFNSAGESNRAAPYFEKAFALAQGSSELSLAIDSAHMLAIAAPPDQQLRWNERALEMAESSSNPNAQDWIGSLLNNTGWSYHDRGDFETALDRFQRAAAWRRRRGQAKETRIADWCVGCTLRSLGRYDEALAIQRQLAAEWDAAGESDPYVDEELAECLLATGAEEEAQPHFAKAAEGFAVDSWFVEHESERLERLKKLARPTLS